MSALVMVGIDGAATTVGFVVYGQDPVTVAVVAVGRGLEDLAGIPSALDPRMVVTRLAPDGSAAVVAENDGWHDNTPDQLVALGLAPPASGDAGIVLSLSPGPHTVTIYPKQASGWALVQVVCPRR